jgi:hypothetical protein
MGENIKKDLIEMGSGDWAGLIRLRIGTRGGEVLVNTVINLRIP